MTSPSEVNNVGKQISSISTSIHTSISGLANSWKGNSKDQLTNKAQKVLDEIFNTITSQLSQFAQAVVLAEKYKELKKEYERLEILYNSLKNNEDSALRASEVLQKMMKVKQEMEILKKTIQGILDGISGTSSSTETVVPSNTPTTGSDNNNINNSNTENNANANYSVSSGKRISDKAKEIHEYMEENNYTYCVYDSNGYEECDDYGKNHGLDKTFEESKTKHHNTCCATYVSWVLQETGYITDAEHTDHADTLSNMLEKKGWTRVPIDELEPGDVMVKSNHVQIYGEDGIIYNAGSGNSIRNDPSDQSCNMKYGLRAPEEN